MMGAAREGKIKNWPRWSLVLASISSLVYAEFEKAPLALILSVISLLFALMAPLLGWLFRRYRRTFPFKVKVWDGLYGPDLISNVEPLRRWFPTVQTIPQMRNVLTIRATTKEATNLKHIRAEFLKKEHWYSLEYQSTTLDNVHITDITDIGLTPVNGHKKYPMGFRYESERDATGRCNVFYTPEFRLPAGGHLWLNIAYGSVTRDESFGKGKFYCLEIANLLGDIEVKRIRKWIRFVDATSSIIPRYPPPTKPDPSA